MFSFMSRRIKRKRKKYCIKRMNSRKERMNRRTETNECGFIFVCRVSLFVSRYA